MPMDRFYVGYLFLIFNSVANSATSLTNVQIPSNRSYFRVKRYLFIVKVGYISYYIFFTYSATWQNKYAYWANT